MMTTTKTLTTYQQYRSMRWTTDADKCEHCGKVTLAEGSCVEGAYGWFCSAACRKAEGLDWNDGPSDDSLRQSERSQMGFCNF